ncbi:hypothetical protein [Massilia endophytica]|uniref:hypothetical protein n=1 Tax=Massilia endophytica TaxID=2899220 RepID=UPI001E55341D|nr:hypothetical protein [Massilia endophytica]UGQ44657.1 hypothetical protein LSQ66_12670 [Massilia endophytica]
MTAHWTRALLLSAACLMASGAQAAPADAALAPYVAALRAAPDPATFVNRKLEQHDVLIFDDGLHSAKDPWQFYIQLVRNPEFASKVGYIFLEVAPLNHQPLIDAWMDGKASDEQLLPLFQDASDMGWALTTYLDLLKAVREANAGKPAERRMRVIATDMPATYPLQRTHQDWEQSRLSGTARDYHMYSVVKEVMGDFKQGRKGILLTNTRHAYKGIRNSKGQFYWNAGTFFSQHSPGKSYSLRVHAPILFIKKRGEGKAATREGLDNVEYRWVRMEKGLWDSAFDAAGGMPKAVELAGTPFGKASYLGNHMLDAAPGQTIADAYDAVIFPGPLDQYQASGTFDIYTPAFKRELKRRIEMIDSPEQQAGTVKQYGSIEAFVDAVFKPKPDRPDPIVKMLPPKDEWKADAAK